MSWPASIGVALVCAVVGLLAAGYTANLVVGWYRITSFEGASGYFIVALALFGGLAGLVIGGIVARLSSSTFLPGAALAVGVVLGLTAVIGATARLLADVPPRLDGDRMLVALELRWPESERDAPNPAGRDPHVQLRSLAAGNSVRASERGALWIEDARLVDGRWTVPGAVLLFTERGRRAVEFRIDDSVRGAALVPLPARPRRRHLEWSEWLPADTIASPDGLTYRFRVHRSADPIRTERYGPFEITLIANGFYPLTGPHDVNGTIASGRFELRHNGEPLPIVAEAVESDYGKAATRSDRIGAVAVVEGPDPALLVRSIRYDSPTFLVVSSNEGVRVEQLLSDLPPGFAGFEVTSDETRFTAGRSRSWPDGRLERGLFGRDRIYYFGTALLDTRSLRVHQLNDAGGPAWRRWDPPVGLAPDARSFVRMASADVYGDVPLVAVTALDGTGVYTLPIDRARMRFVSRDSIGPDWLLHHFEWVADTNGDHRLVERRSFVPLPWRGELSVDSRGGYREYRIDLATEELVDAVLAALVSEFDAEQLPAEYGPDSYLLRIDGIEVSLRFDRMSRYLVVTRYQLPGEHEVVPAIAEHLDALLASGQFDQLIVP